MPDKPVETTNQTGEEAPLVDPAEQMPSLVEETVTEGLDPDEYKIRATDLK
jgi:hypothetical protein